jgi:hypothetical protein
VYLRASPEAAQLALRLGTDLAEAGAVVHLSLDALPATLDHAYVVALGEPANEEVSGVAGRVAIGPTALALDPASTQPLLLIRSPESPSLEPTARPVWELRFAGLAKGFNLTIDEEHSLIEAVVLWVRERAKD